MTESLVGRRRNIQSRPKVKTGCATCRIRKVKCDENKPFCQKCVSTGRTCDGYESPFRIVLTKQSMINNHVDNIKSYGNGLLPLRSTLPGIGIGPREIELLGRYFSTKTMFDIQLDCNEEAREILQASLTDATIRQAVSSLKALRNHLEASRAVVAFVVQQPSREYDHGLRQYCEALRGLASRISSPGSGCSRSALLCCQIFISIEQARGNYAAMTQHMIRGLGIMQEYRARPHFVGNRLAPANGGKVPLLDVFIIKLFIAPCKFADPPATVPTTDMSGTTSTLCPLSSHSKSGETRKPRTIAPDLRAALTRIAKTTLEFLSRILRVESVADALQLLPEKASLQDSLELWSIDLEIFLMDIRPPQIEPLSVSFLRFFHQILRIVLIGALQSSLDHNSELRTEMDQLYCIASNIEEGVKAYRMWGALSLYSS